MSNQVEKSNDGYEPPSGWMISKLKQLSEPFAEEDCGYKPKPSKNMKAEIDSKRVSAMWCEKCSQFHHPKAIHLKYVGHAAVTKRLLDVDPLWNWEPVSVDQFGKPVLDDLGGLWIKLTILGITRLGYGDAEGKQGADAIKEIIGDAIRNGAMRFGVATDLWHKGEFQKKDAEEELEQGQEAIHYSDELFNQNFPEWERQIQVGGKKAGSIIAFLAKKGINLSDAQVMKINNVEVGK